MLVGTVGVCAPLASVRIQAIVSYLVPVDVCPVAIELGKPEISGVLVIKDSAQPAGQTIVSVALNATLLMVSAQVFMVFRL
jgi:hypothetical protein